MGLRIIIGGAVREPAEIQHIQGARRLSAAAHPLMQAALIQGVHLKIGAAYPYLLIAAGLMSIADHPPLGAHLPESQER
jgi:hypothetical protein